ncbi:uncharacterized protein LOC108022966 [Drosophila biarmipes]|uniref:uncharacterized protein LOC108022966 n=1 Tax=Drosophila biarmipes TaxID=125945 RepID=UPI0007E5C6DF|nr:uncharacterized protein LOC108022966 [Drosophila biarmipes]
MTAFPQNERRRVKETITRIPVAACYRSLKKMKKSGERCRKMAEIVFSIFLTDKAEDIALDLVMFKILEVENTT